jgi:Cu/Ag efflux pump CusA
VALAHIIFPWHFRSILIVTIPLPVSILISFILMRQFGINSNIMSLSGIALAIGVLVDAGIVMTEKLSQAPGYVPGFLHPIEGRILMLSTGSEVMRPLATPVIGGQNRQPRDALAAATRWRFFSNLRPAWCILGPL